MKIFLRNLVISVAVAMVFCAVAGVIAQKWVISTLESEVSLAQDSLIDYYQLRYLTSQKSNPDATKEDLLANALDYCETEIAFGKKYVPLENILFSAGVLCNMDKREVVLDSKGAAYIEMQDGIAFCHDSRLAEYKEFYSGVWNWNARVKDYYIIDDRKYFGEVEFCNDFSGETVLADFSPVDAHKYEHVVLDENQVGWAATHYVNEMEDAKELDALYEYVGSEPWYDTNLSGYTYDVNGLVITVMKTRFFFMPDGTKFRVFHRANIDIYEYNKDEIWAVAIGSLALSVIIGSLLAYIKYIKLKATREMEVYRNKLTDSMAHDLKSPLMAISGYAENMILYSENDKEKYYSNSIIQNVQYMNNIISHILDLSKLEKGKIKLVKQKIEIGKLIESVLNKYEELIAEKRLTVELTGSFEVMGDELLLSQALDNIVNNAIKYSVEESIISISADGEKQVLRITNIFDSKEIYNVNELENPFVKGSASRSDKSGSGIGLSISKAIFEMHKFKQNISCDDKRFVVTVKM